MLVTGAMDENIGWTNALLELEAFRQRERGVWVSASLLCSSTSNMAHLRLDEIDLGSQSFRQELMSHARFEVLESDFRSRNCVSREAALPARLAAEGGISSLTCRLLDSHGTNSLMHSLPSAFDSVMGF